jgi:hypothetical protein
MTESLYHRDDKPGAVTPLFVLRQQVAEMFRSGGDYGIRESAAQVYPDHYDVGGGDLGVVLHEGLALSVWGSSSYGAPLRTPRPGTPVRESA